jgi:two-component sensor histidine kinase
VQSMARHTARTSVNGKQFIARFRDRLTALSAAHYLLVRNSFRGVDLEELVRSQLLDADRLIGQRVRLSGPPLSLRPDAAQHFAMALSVLSSNAVAHGALAAGEGEGEVEASWRVEEAEGEARLVFVWNERPAQARAPARAPGFGSVIITRMAPRALHARVSLDHRPEGTVCAFDMPLAMVAASAAAARPPAGDV